MNEAIGKANRETTGNWPALAELHVHLEGAVSPDFARELANKNRLEIEGLFDENGDYSWHDFLSFLGAYDRLARLFRTAEDFHEAVYRYLGKIAGEGAIYAEITAAPDHGARAGLDYQDYISAIIEAITRAKQDFGIEARIIITAVRHFGPEAAVKMARLAERFSYPEVTGFGLAGNEGWGHPRQFAKAFAIAHGAGLNLTAHAGEFAGAESVRDALDHLKVSRIGHGVRAVEDTELIRRIADEGIILEICPSSNIALGLYKNFANHPIEFLRRNNCLITLNSDDPPFFRSSLRQEYEICAREYGWRENILRKITCTAIMAAFCDQSTKAKLLDRAGCLNEEAAHRPEAI